MFQVASLSSPILPSCSRESAISPAALSAALLGKCPDGRLSVALGTHLWYPKELQPRQARPDCTGRCGPCVSVAWGVADLAGEWARFDRPCSSADRAPPFGLRRPCHSSASSHAPSNPLYNTHATCLSHTTPVSLVSLFSPCVPALEGARPHSPAPTSSLGLPGSPSPLAAAPRPRGPLISVCVLTNSLPSFREHAVPPPRLDRTQG